MIGSGLDSYSWSQDYCTSDLYGLMCNGLDLVPILGIITIIGGLDFTPDFGLFGQDLVWI